MYRVKKKEFYGKGDFTYKSVSPLFETKKEAEACIKVLIDMQINVLGETSINMSGDFPNYIVSEEEYKDLTEWIEDYANYVARTYGLENVEAVKFADKYRKLVKYIMGSM